MAVEQNPDLGIPYVPFTKDRGLIDISGLDVYKYIAPELMDKFVNNLSEKVKLNDFEYVLVNMNGGKYLFDKLAKKQNYEKAPVLIEYHRPEGGYSANVTIPVPIEAKNKKCLIVDDIYDTGGVLKAIMEEVGPGSHAVVLITKKDIENQIPVENLVIGVRIDNKWIAGCGMDIGLNGEANRFRDLEEIVVKPLLKL